MPSVIAIIAAPFDVVRIAVPMTLAYLSVPLIGVTPPIAYPIAFYVTLVATLFARAPRDGSDASACGFLR